MGNVALTVPRAVLTNHIQLHFKAGKVADDVGDLVRGWLQDGAPLGLTVALFQEVLGLQDKVQEVFDAFDTDRNGKVDAFEVLSVVVVLAHGSLDDKIEALVPVFDFSGDAVLNFDEVNILVHSVYRGLHKICKTPVVPDVEIVDICRRMFDSHNLPYDRPVTKEQFKRWLRSDVDASAFIDIFHNAYALPDIEVALAQKEQTQAVIFTQLSRGGGSAAVTALHGSEAFRRALGHPSEEELEVLLSSMGTATDSGWVSLASFVEAVRSFNVFEVLDIAREGSLPGKELHVLMWLHHRQQPPDAAVKKLRDGMALMHGLSEDDRFTRSTWVACILDDRKVG